MSSHHFQSWPTSFSLMRKKPMTKVASYELFALFHFVKLHVFASCFVVIKFQIQQQKLVSDSYILLAKRMNRKSPHKLLISITMMLTIFKLLVLQKTLLHQIKKSTKLCQSHVLVFLTSQHRTLSLIQPLPSQNSV